MGNTKNIKDLEKDKFTTNDQGEVCVRVCVDNLSSGGSDASCETYMAGETLSAVKLVYISAANTVSLADKDTKPSACAIGIFRGVVKSTIEVMAD